jgi:hypothetical protein
MTSQLHVSSQTNFRSERNDRHDDAGEEDIFKTFAQLANTTPKRLGEWLETDESRKVGQKEGGSESVGHRSGRHIVGSLAKRNQN